MYNFDEVKKSEVKNKARELAIIDIFNMLCEKFGTDEITRTETTTFAVHSGDRTLDDGTVSEVCFTVDITVKEFEGRRTEKKEIPYFDRIKLGDRYEEEQEKKKTKKEEQTKNKKAEIERDKKARESKKE